MSTVGQYLDQLGVTAIALRCANPACASELPIRPGPGRRRSYCSHACKARVRAERHIVSLALQQVQHDRWPTGTSTATKRSVRAHLSALATQLGLATDDRSGKAPPPPAPRPPAHHTDPVYPDYLFNGREERWRETVDLTWGIFPFDVSVIFEQFASAQVTLDEEMERLIKVEEDPNVPKTPMTDAQFRLIRLAAHMADLLDHLYFYLSFPIEAAWYERTFLQEDGNGEYGESNARATVAEKAWIARNRHERSSYPKWPIPSSSTSLRQFAYSLADRRHEHLESRKNIRTPRQIEEDAMQETSEAYQDELAGEVYGFGDDDE